MNYETNKIIEYHFEDSFHNIMLDIKELLSFQEKIKTLSDEDILLYKRISNKNISNDELKKINIKEKFYYDIRKAKNESYTNIKENLINIEKENKIMKGQDFYALIKCTNIKIGETFQNIFDSGSFSLISHDKLTTFRNPLEYITLVYSAFNIKRVVHVCSVDSKSNYDLHRPVNELHTKESLIKSSNEWNEIVINGGMKISGILCFDFISQYQKELANNLRIGILLIDRNKYKKKTFDNEISMSSFLYRNHDQYIVNNDNNNAVRTRKYY